MAAESRRPSATTAGPKTGDAIRINIKEPPQIADSRTRRKPSEYVITKGPGNLFLGPADPMLLLDPLHDGVSMLF